MATEELIVLLDAKTAKLDAKLNSTNAKLNKLGGSTAKTDTKLSKMSATAAAVGKALGVATVAVGALTAGTVALINKTTQYAKEIKIASQLSGVAAEQLQTMAFATNTVGINIQKLGDISKDTREKIGDFLNTGGGGFQDFVDAMKLTKDEAALVAEEFSHMAGPDILQEMVNRMQEADVSAVQMSHALEGMASDTTNLISLMLDGGKGVRELSSAMDGVTVPLTEEDLKKLADLDVALSLAAKSASSLANKTLVDLSDWFVNAANAASFFFASLNDGTRADLQTELLGVLDDIQDIESALLTGDAYVKKRLQGDLDALIAEREAIIDALAALDAKNEAPKTQETKPKNEEDKKPGFPESADDIEKRKQAVLDSLKTEQEALEEKYIAEQELFKDNAEVLLELQEKYNSDLAELNRDRSLEAIIERFKTEEELLYEKLEREREIIGEDKELREKLENKFIENMIAIDERHEEEKAKIAKKAADKIAKEKAKEDKAEKKLNDEKEEVEEKRAKDSVELAYLVFGENKAISATSAFINTAEGVTKALSKQDYVGAALTAATGAVQISSILSSSPGSTGSTGSIGSSSSQTQENSFTPDVGSDLEIRDSTSSGTTQARISFADDSGDDIIDAIAKALNKGQSEGRYV
jgi:hypothetical protein